MVKDLVLSLLWLRFSPWPAADAAQKKKKKPTQNKKKNYQQKNT